MNKYKKLLLTAFVMLTARMVLHGAGDYRETPRGNAQALATADYGGVDVATAAFSSNFSTAAIDAQGVFYGVCWSSGALSAFDFVDVFDASNTVTANANSQLMIRVYNTSLSTSPTVGLAIAGCVPTAIKPMRYHLGLIFKPNVATYNMINVLHYRFRDVGN